MASDKLCCPFCAAEGRETSETDSDYPSKRFMFIQCSRCGARTASIYGSGDPSEWADARLNWNTRITSPTATDAPGEQNVHLRNLQTWLVCREIGNALAPSLETVQDWLAALGDITGEAPPDFVMKAPKRDNSRCKFAAGGACCSSHCGDPACLASAHPTATDAQGVGEAPKAVAEPVRISVEEMVESVNGVSWWVVLRRGKHRQDDGKYGAEFKNRAEWHAAGLRWILGQGDKPNILDFMDESPTASTTTGLTEAAKELPPLPEPYTVASTIKCVACGAPYEPSRVVAPMAAYGMFSPKMTSSECKCGSTTFAGTLGYDSPSPVKYTSDQLVEYARACAEKWNVRLDGGTAK